MTTTPFSYPVSVQLDSTGNGTASAGPLSAREVWHVQTVAVSVNDTTDEAVCVVYVGDAPQPRNQQGATSTGSSGDSTGQVAKDVKVGNRVWAAWTGGTPFAMATMVVTGTRDV